MNVEQIKCKGLGRNSDRALQAGKELAAGESRAQTSIPDGTANVPSTIFRDG